MPEITVAGLVVEVEMLDTNTARRVSLHIAESQPVTGDWPLSLADIEKRSLEIFQRSGAEAGLSDVEWCINRAGFNYLEENDRYMFRVVPTPSVQELIREAALEEARDGIA